MISPFADVRVEKLPPVPASLVEHARRLAREGVVPAGSERRRSPRRFVVTEALVRPIDRDFRPAGEARRALTFDVSGGGIRIFTVRHVAAPLLAVRLDLKQLGPVDLAVMVRRVTPAGRYYETGGQFLDRFGESSPSAGRAAGRTSLFGL